MYDSKLIFEEKTMLFVGYLVVVSILVRHIEGYIDARFVMIKGGLDDATTSQLLTDFHRDRPNAASKCKSSHSIRIQSTPPIRQVLHI